MGATLAVTSVTADRGSPFTADGVTSVTWTANATGGLAPLQYAFYRTKAGPGAAPVLVQAYSTSGTYTRTPAVTDSGTYTLLVLVRSAGSTASFQGSLISAAFVVAVLPTVNSITVNRATPFAADGVTSVTWTANTTGGIAPLQYAFCRTKACPGAAPVLVQVYSTSATYTWTPALTDDGTYTIMVLVRNAGSTASFQGSLISAAFVVAVLSTLNSITVNRATPFAADGVTSVTWTANATGGIAPLQ